MFNKITSILLLFIFSTQFSFAQKLETLRPSIEKILSQFKAKVGIAIHNADFTDSILFHAGDQFPLQSTYKFHLGIVVLHQVDQGKLSLDQPVKFSKEMLTSNTYSPIKDKYPNGTSLPLREVLQYTIAKSDNIGCDAMFELIGGTEVADRYFADLGYTGLAIKLTEEVQQANWDMQFQNWTTVGTSNRILYDFYKNANKQLSPTSYQFLWDTMRSTSTGKDRLKGLLPAGTVVAHKTGYSGINDKTKVIAAVNDIGVVSLPNGEEFYISAYVTDSKETEPQTAKIIAEVSKAAYDYFVVNSGK